MMILEWLRAAGNTNWSTLVKVLIMGLPSVCKSHVELILSKLSISHEFSEVRKQGLALLKLEPTTQDDKNSFEAD